MEKKTCKVILHTPNGDVITTFDGSQYSEVAMDLVRSYLRDGKDFTIEHS